MIVLKHWMEFRGILQHCGLGERDKYGQLGKLDDVGKESDRDRQLVHMPLGL